MPARSPGLRTEEIATVPVSAAPGSGESEACLGANSAPPKEPRFSPIRSALLFKPTSTESERLYSPPLFVPLAIIPTLGISQPSCPRRAGIGYSESGMPKDVVLCVDDEPIVLRACTISVAIAGFRPVVAENGAAGLDAFIQLRDEVCLVLSDIIMPAVNGIDMAESILQIDPQAKILLMSGYSDGIIERQGRNRFAFIRKPFIHSVLIEKIRSMVRPGTEAAASGS